MGRFHFNIRNGSGETRDEEGRELADPQEAEALAVEGARSLLSEEVLAGDLDLRGCIEVTDDAGRVIFTVAFKDVLTLREGPLPTPGDESRRIG